jgi:hypothetical protein
MRRLLLLLGLTATAGPSVVAQALAVTRDAQVARVQATGLLDDGRFVNLMRSGFPLRLHYRLELWAVRSGWFDRYVTGAEWDAVARHDPLSDDYILVRTGGSVSRYSSTEDLAKALALPYRVALRADGNGRFYLVCRLDVTTLNNTDLEELARWLKGDVTPAVSGHESLGQALAHGAQRVLVRIAGLPSLTLEGRSDVFSGEIGSQ